MKKLLCILVTLMLIGTCALAECPAITPEDYPVVDGSTATLPLSYLLMETAAGVDEDTAKATIHHNKTTESFYALVSGSADLLLVYEPSQDAWDYAKEEGVELLVQSIGYDAPVFLINDGNPVTSLTHEQLVDIYAGKITNWSEVGGEDLDIVAYQRIENSGSQVMMKAQVMKDVPMMDAPTTLRTSEMGELVDAIASYKNTANSIGYSVYYYIDNMYMKEGIKLLSINGVAPTNDTIASGEYPYRQPFYAVVRADAPEDSPARKLYDWLATPEGHALVADAGYVAAPAEE
jgi:phosphate transport system substrate-binding protein